MSGIYIHIPFCKQACSYCDFFFVTREGYREQFVKKLVNEIRLYGDTPYANETVRTIYFGGGTPSLLEHPELEKIMKALNETFRIEPEEVTLEMNPDDVSKEYLTGLRDLGVTRSSMGVQSFKPDILEFMNRAHDRDEALACLEMLHAAGFRTFTVDLIYGNPGQTLMELQEDLDTLLEFDPPHVSAYSLTVEPKTRLGKQVKLGRIDPPDDDKVADHFDLVVDRLREAGIRQYEVSNYSRPGHEAVHNSNYWRHENYLGLGPSAHTFWWNGNDNDKALRWKNRSDLMAYLEDEPGSYREDEERLSSAELAEERLMMGMRTREGVSFDELTERYDYRLNDRQREYLEKREEEGKINTDAQSIRLTRKGLKIADAIILDLVTLTA